jgi:ketosteroid isomerase-like protein
VLAGLLSVWSSAAAFAADPQDEARALLDRWLDDQNKGDFAAYEKLYADDFIGVRRSGPRTATFDRSGWLQDRQRMFRKKMEVEAQNVRVFARPGSARVVFTQRWSSGSYHDLGPKHLVLRHAPGGYQIVREELFASDTRAPGAIDVVAFRQFAFVVDGEVIVSMNPDEAWATGPAKIDPNPAETDLVRVRRQVDPKKLPAEVAQIAGSQVLLMDAKGVRCEARLGGFLLRSRVAITDTEDGPPPWSMTANFLVATVANNSKACAGATWARSAKLPAPPVTTASTPNAKMRARAVAAFRALPQSQAIQRRFAKWYARQGYHVAPAWFSQEKDHPTVRVMAVVNGPTLLSVSATINDGDCSDDVRGSLWALWQVDGPADNPRLILRNQPDESMTMQPTAAVDVDGDGRVELLFDGFSDYTSANALGQPLSLEHGIVRALGDSYVNVEGPETPILICPC